MTTGGDKPPIAVEDDEAGVPQVAYAGDDDRSPGVAIDDRERGGQAGPVVTSRFRKPEKANREFPRRIDQLTENGLLSTCDVLGIPEDEARGKGVKDDEVREQINEFFKGEPKGGDFASLKNVFPHYKRFTDKLHEIRMAPAPAAQLRQLAAEESLARGRKKLVAEAERALRDRVLEWREHADMLKYAREELGLDESLVTVEVERAYTVVEEEFRRRNPSAPGFRRESKPPPPMEGWAPHPDLSSSNDLWLLPDLQEAMLDNFAKAVEVCSGGELIKYLKYQRPGGQRDEALHAAEEAVRVAQEPGKDYPAELAVWIFLWRTGRTELHVTSSLKRGRMKCRTPGELFERVLERATTLGNLGTLLDAGLLEHWFRITGGSKEAGRAAATAAKTRNTTRAGMKSQVADALWKGTLETLWDAGMSFFPVPLDDGASVEPAKSAAEIVRLIDTAGRVPKVIERAVKTGALGAWLAKSDPRALAKLQESESEGDLTPLTWAWRSGATALPVGKGEQCVRSLDELLALTDTRKATLSDEAVISGQIEAWCRLVPHSDQLADLAKLIRRDAKPLKAERWRQGAGAKELSIGGCDASTPEAFAQLALLAHRGRGVTASDIIAALDSDVPQVRFSRANPGLATTLRELVGHKLPPDQKALLACLAAGLRILPISWPQTSLSLEMASISDAVKALHRPGFRERFSELVSGGIVEWWLAGIGVLRPPLQEVVRRWAAVCAAGDRSKALAAADAILRFAGNLATCFLLPDFSPSTVGELRAGLRSRKCFALLHEASVRHRVRDALGFEGGLPLPDARGMQGPTEADLLRSSPEVAAHTFAWGWLQYPILWLDDANVVTSREDLLRLLESEPSRGVVRHVANTPVFCAWLVSGIAVGQPIVTEAEAPFDDAAFARLALWLGDSPATPSIAADAALLMPEGGRRTIDVAIQNNDGVRGVDVILTALTSEGLSGSFDGQASKGLWLEAGQVVHVSLELTSNRGHSGNQQVTLTVAFSRSQTAPAFEVPPLAEAAHNIAVRVEFPGRALVVNAVAGVAVGGVLGAVFRGIRTAVIPEATFETLAASSGAALPAALASRGTGLVLWCVLFLMLGFRIFVGSRSDKTITSKAVEFAFKTGAGAAMILGPINGCRGCADSTHLGTDSSASGCTLGFGEGVGFGAALFFFLLLRPGLVERNKDRAVGYDVLFGVGGVALLASSALGDALVRALLYLEVGARSVAAAFGSAGPLSEGGIVGAYVFIAAFVGLLLALRRTLVSVGRPLLGYAQLSAGLSLLFVVTSARGTAARIQGETGMFSPSSTECASTVEHAARVSYAEGASPASPAFEVFRESPEYKTESEEALRRCRTARREAVECVAKATSRAAIAACGPFWMGD